LEPRVRLDRNTVAGRSIAEVAAGEDEGLDEVVWLFQLAILGLSSQQFRVGHAAVPWVQSRAAGCLVWPLEDHLLASQ
jgi:hypothetical protein